MTLTTMHGLIMARLATLAPNMVQEVKADWYGSPQELADKYATEGYNFSRAAIVSYFNSEQFQPGAGTRNTQYCRLDTAGNFFVGFVLQDMGNPASRAAVADEWRQAFVNLLLGYEFGNMSAGAVEPGWVNVIRGDYFHFPEKFFAVYTCRVSWHEVVGSNGA
jgi:hypothetical protein